MAFMKVPYSSYVEEKIISIASTYSWFASFLSVFWKKALLKKIATNWQRKGALRVPLSLYIALNNRSSLDTKKYNGFNFKTKVLSHQFSLERKVAPILSNENKSVLLLVHNSLPYDSAGYALRTINEAKAYISLGYKVVIVTRMGYPWDLIKHKNQPRKSSQWIDGVEIISFEGERKYKVDSDIKYAIEYGIKIAKIVKQREISFIQASSNYINGFAAYFASIKSNVPYIYEARGMWHVTRGSGDISFRQSEQFQYEEKMERFVLNHASANVFITHIMRDLYLKDRSKPNSILRNCISPEINSFKSIAPPFCTNRPLKLIYAGSLVFYEGIDVLIDAVSELSPHLVTLDIYGDGPFKLNVEKQLVNADVNHITYHGKVDAKHIGLAYSNADVVVVPRIDTEVTRMVPPLKPIEGLVYELPVIVSDLPAIRELTHEFKGVFYVEPGSKLSLINAITLLSEEYDEFKALVESDSEIILRDRTWACELKSCLSQVFEI